MTSRRHGGAVLGPAPTTRRDPGVLGPLVRAWVVAMAAACIALATSAVAAAQTAQSIRTVPAIAGIRIAVDGRVARTDEQGVAKFGDPARITGDAVAVLDRKLRLPGDRRARFSKLRRTATGYVAAFDIDYRVMVDARTVGGAPIDAQRTSRILLRSPLTGERAHVRAGDEVWLHGTRVVAELGTVRPRDLPWTVQGFEVDGEQVVSRGKQRLVPAELPAHDRTVTVRARLFTAEILVRDALLGSPTGAAVLLTRPDGERSRHTLDTDGRVRVSDLVPGAYDVAVLGSGPLISRPVTLSRDQDITLDVYSWWDIAIVAVLVVLFFVGLAAAGRRRRRPHDAGEHADHPTEPLDAEHRGSAVGR